MKINLCNSNQVTCESMAEVKHFCWIEVDVISRLGGCLFGVKR